MKVYRLSPITEEFGMLELDAPAIAEVFGDLGFNDIRETDESILEDWPVSDGGFYNLYSTEGEELEQAPDVYLWNGSMLALSSKARDKLEPKLKLFGEFLPFEYRDQEFYIFSCFSIVEADPDQSEELIEYDVPMGIKSLAFKSEDIGTQPLIKTEFDNFAHLYCTDSFKDLVLGCGLDVGITFEEDLSYRRRV